MKVTVDVDCTPEEARRLMGLPDLTEVHAAYIEKLRSAISEGIGPDYLTDMMKSWGPMGESAFGMWKTMFEQMPGQKK